MNLINPRRHCLKFKWDVGVMSGEYNAIAVGVNVMHSPYAGVSVYRGLEMSNYAVGETEPMGCFLRPGIKTADYTVTGENEILIGGADTYEYSRKVLNLLTGEVTPLATTDARYGLYLYDSSVPQLVVNGNFYHFSGNNSNYISRRSIDDNFSTENGSTFSSVNTYKKSLFTYNGYIYVQKTTTKFYAYDPTTYSAVSAQHITISNCNMPDTMQTNFTNSSKYCAIINVGENYLVEDGSTGFGILCSNPTDVIGTMIKIIPRSYYYNGVTIAGINYYFYNNSSDKFFGSSSGIYPTASGSVQSSRKGLKILKENLTGNFLSFATFDEPQPISTTEATVIEYYYYFGE